MRLSITFCVLFCLAASNAEAGAWLQPKGHGQIIMQAGYFESDRFYDSNGTSNAQDSYEKYELQPYLEYGLSDRLTVGGSFYAQYVSQSGAHNTGIADPELFARVPLWSSDKARLSLQPLIKFKSSYDSTTPRGGSRSTDAELSLVYGRNLPVLSPRDYLDTRLGYRARSGDLHNQWRADLAFGLGLTPQWMLIPAVRAIKATDLGATTSSSSGDGDLDYDLLKLELGSSYALSSETTLSLTAFDHLAARQSGNGMGLMFGIRRAF